MKQFRQNIRQKLWYKIVSWVSVPLVILFGIHVMEYMNYRSVSAVFDLWSRNFGTYKFSLLITLILSAVLLFICKKIWVFTAVYGGLSLILGTINCVKLIVNGDYFYPWDVVMAGEMGDLVGFAEFSLPPLFWVAIPVVIIGAFALWLGDVELPLKWYIRIPSAVIAFIPFIILFNNPTGTERLLNSFGMSFENSVLQSSNYKNNGFVSAFSMNCFALKVSEPEGYNEEQVTSYLANYDTKEGTETPDVIVIMSEAFYDIRDLKGTTFSQNPLSNYDEICARENAISGDIFTTAHGGGTVRTEFEAITGLTVDYLINGTSPYLYITDDTEGYVSNYKSQGYHTTAIHSYEKTFYMRNEAYPRFAFDEFIASDTMEQNYPLKYRRGYILDDIFMDVVIDTLEKNSDTPNFIYGITMENHGGYDKSPPENIVIDVKNDSLDQAQLDSVTTYTQGLYYADLSLKKLVDYIDNREKPTILLFFGDHKPALGGYQAAYNQAGNINISDGYDSEESKYVYSAQYVMYANYDVDYGVLEQSPDMSSYYLLTHIAKVTGTKMTPYMNYLYDNYLDLPYYNVRLGIELDEKGKNFINSMKLITYDRVKGNGYSLTK